MSGLIRRMEEQIKMALPRYLDPGRFVRVVLTQYNQNPKLWACSDVSFLAAVMTAAQLGLEPDGTLNEGYIIPYGTKAQFQTGWRGILKLARNTGNIKDVQLESVFEKDKFIHVKGLNPDLQHKPCDDADPGEITHVYFIVRFMNGGFQYKVMSKAQIIRIRDKYSKAYISGLSRIHAMMKDRNISEERAIEILSESGQLSPWFTNEEAMMKKTVAIQGCKLLDLSADVRKQLSREEFMEQGLPVDMPTFEMPDGVVIDARAEEKPDPETEGAPAGETKSDRLADELEGKSSASAAQKEEAQTIRGVPSLVTAEKHKGNKTKWTVFFDQDNGYTTLDEKLMIIAKDCRDQLLPLKLSWKDSDDFGREIVAILEPKV
jgi:recombination protein RecT